jgi:hypothetical protein
MSQRKSESLWMLIRRISMYLFNFFCVTLGSQPRHGCQSEGKMFGMKKKKPTFHGTCGSRIDLILRESTSENCHQKNNRGLFCSTLFSVPTQSFESSFWVSLKERICLYWIVSVVAPYHVIFPRYSHFLDRGRL